MTVKMIQRMIPTNKKASIREIYEDQDGFWIILNDGWNADGIDFDELNCYIDEYNRSARLVNFWFWFNWTAPIDVDVHGFSELWNHNNPNMRFVHSIRGMNA